MASVANAFALFVLVGLSAWNLLEAGTRKVSILLPATNVPLGAPAKASDDQSKPAAIEPALLRRLEQLMTVERIYRRERLTIGSLSAELGVPEYRLRQLINEGLGYRNFNAFLNHYRIGEAKAALVDPEQVEVPVLTIAMDTGFQSIGPFNRAFKAATNLTPTEFRRLAMAGNAAPVKRSIEDRPIELRNSASRFAGIGEKESKTFDRLTAILPRSSCVNGVPHAKSAVCRSIGRAGGAYTLSGGAALADDLQTVGDPDSLGFSARRLARMTSWFEAQSEKGDPSGFVVGVARGGKLAYLQATGFEDHDKKMPMRPDLIFRIGSMSKQITSVATMILVDEGKLDLDAPVAQYLPELRDMQVVKTDPVTGDPILLELREGF